ncbi:MAG: TolA protein [Myxococcaceae bacterium]|nr:TolA protein [Myxococcaceae bacterium]
MPVPGVSTGRLLACAVVLCALAASAQVRRVAAVGLAFSGGDETDAAYGARAVSSFLQSDPRFEWVSPATQARDDGPVREAKGLEARRLFLEGREQLDNLNTAKAIATLEKSIKFWEDSDLSQGVQGLLDALALRAIACLSKGDKSGFNNDAQRVLAINPDYAFDPSRLTPAAQNALAPLKKKVVAAPPAALELVSTPPHAWAFVDGVFRGVTPITVPGLAPGSHVVTLVATGFELVQEKVFAGSGAAPSFALKSSARGKEVLARVGELRAALERDDVGPAAGALATFIQAEELLVAGVSNQKGELKAVVYRVMADGTVVGDARRSLSGTSASSDWQAMAKELLALAAPEPKKPEAVVIEDLPANSRAGRRPIGWIGLALTAGAAGAGIGLGLTSKSTAQQANRTPQVDAATYNRLAGQARTQAYVADGMFALAVVAGGVSIFMLATGYSDDSGASDEEEEAGFLLGPTRDGAFVGLHGSF